MDEAKLRAWTSHKQGLDGRLDGQSAAVILEQSGWARSVGGVGPYLTLFARGGLRRATIDAAVAHLEIHELPSARGCAYVLPASDFALGLKLSQNFGDGEINVARKLGVTDSEVEKLCEAVLKALKKGPLDPEELREAAGGAARSLGEAGRKKGLVTTLPLALGKLQNTGEIRRIPISGRLDQQRYRYTLWKPNPLEKLRLSGGEVNTELARRFFRWIGPATPAEFQWFSGLGARAVKAALEPLTLVSAEEGLLLPEDYELLKAFQTPKRPQYVLVSCLDGISLLRRDLKGLLAPEHWKNTMEPQGLKDLPSHAILDRGRVVGLWEYDPDTQSIAWMPFERKDAAMEQAVKRTEEFVREDLGDARSSSLDSPRSRAPRIHGLRAAAGKG